MWVNTNNIFDAALPFGGYKQSAWGREMGEEAQRWRGPALTAVEA